MGTAPVVKANYMLMIEGPIGIGKTSLINHIKEEWEPGMKVLVMPEIIDAKSLEEFYADPEGKAVQMQDQVLRDLAIMYENRLSSSYAAAREAELVVCDRHIFSVMAFSHALYEMGSLTKAQYHKLRDSVLREIAIYGVVPDMVVHLVCKKNLCMKHIEERARPGEDKITREYLAALDYSTMKLMRYLRHNYNMKVLEIMVNQETTKEYLEECIRLHLMEEKQFIGHRAWDKYAKLSCSSTSAIDETDHEHEDTDMDNVSDKTEPITEEVPEEEHAEKCE